MSKKRARAREVASPRGPGAFWIDHAEVVEDDYEWLQKAERLTLWNVHVPFGFFARLPSLWWLDVRGGSAADLSVVRGVKHLQYLAVNQVRGLHDLAILPEFLSLRFLMLYGLPQVTTLPSLAPLRNLERAEIGQMRGLRSLAGLLDAPELRELQFLRKLSVNSDDVQRIIKHPTIEQFDWFAEDVPDHVCVPVIESIHLPPPPVVHPGEWFAKYTRGQRVDVSGLAYGYKT